MTKYKIAFYLGLARVIGKLLGALKRRQTQLLSLAQFNGWRPDGEEAQQRLARDQFHLYMWRRNKAELKKLKWEKKVKA